MPVGERDGTVVTFIAVGHWRPGAMFAGWRPVLSAGYARQVLGSVNAAPDELPPDAVGPGWEPGGTEQRPLSLEGNGARFGIAGERPFTRQMALTIEAAADVVHFDVVHFDGIGYDGFSYSLHDGGWSTTPRLGVGVRWWPFSR